MGSSTTTRIFGRGHPDKADMGGLYARGARRGGVSPPRDLRGLSGGAAGLPSMNGPLGAGTAPLHPAALSSKLQAYVSNLPGPHAQVSNLSSAPFPLARRGRL